MPACRISASFPGIRSLLRHCLPLLLIAAGILHVPEALAQSCSYSTGDASFGSRSSVAVRDVAQDTSTSNSLSCSGGVFSFFTSGNTIRATPTSTNSFNLTRSGGYQVPYVAHYINPQNGNRSQLVQGQEINTNFFNFFSIFGGTSFDFTVEFATAPGAVVPAGTYTDSISMRWDSRICTAGLFICVLYSNNTAFTTINVQLVVENDCEMNTPNLHFGTAPLVGVFDPVTQTLSIRCSAGAAYTVGMSDGSHFDGTSRRMRRGASADYLRYELFQAPASPDRWGSTGAQRRSSTSADTSPGTHDGITWQGFTYRGVIDPDQTTPPSGVYTDNIVVDVQF